MANDREVELLLQAKNLTSEAFTAVRKAIKALEEQSERTTNNGSASWGKWFKTIAGGVVVGNLVTDAFRSAGRLIAEVPAKLIELGERGSEVAELRHSFEALTSAIGESGDEMIAVTRRATKGLVTDMDIMAASNKALLLGLPVTSQEMGTLAQTALVLGGAMRVGPTQALDNLITGLGRGSAMILDNLGITVNAEEAYQKYAASIHKSASELTESEKKLAVYRAALEAAGQSVDAIGEVQLTFGQRLQQGRVWVQNLTDSLGVAIATSPAVNEAMTTIGLSVDGAFGEQRSATIRRFVGWVNQVAIVVGKAALVGVDGADVLGRAWQGLQTIVLGSMAAIMAGIAGFVRGTESAAKVAAFLSPFDASLQGVARRIGETRVQLDAMTASLWADTKAAASGVMGNGVYFETLGRVRSGLESTVAAMVKASREKVSDAQITAASTRRTAEHATAMAGAGKSAASFAKELSTLNSRITQAERDARPLVVRIEEFGKKAADAEREAERLGVAVPAAVAKMAAAWRELVVEQLKATNDQELRADYAKVLEGMLKDTQTFEERRRAIADRAYDQDRQTRDAVAAENRRRTMGELEFTLDTIRREQEEKKEALDQYSFFYAQNLATIEAETEQRMEAAKEAHNQKVREMEAAVVSWGDVVTGILGRVPGLIQSAFTGGGGFSGAMKALMSDAGASITDRLFGAASGTGGLGNKLAQSLLGSGASSSIAGLAGNLVNGIIPVLGSMVGPLVSKFAGLFHTPEHEKVMEDVGRRLGRGISEGLAKEIAALEKTIEGGTKDQRRKWAEALSLDKIIAEFGGINSGNVAKWSREAMGLLEIIERGGETGQQAVAELGTVFGQLSAEVVKSNKLADASFVQLLSRAQQTGQQVAGVQDFLQGQSRRAGSGFDRLAGSVDTSEDAAVDIPRYARLERFGVASFEALRASGLSYLEALDAIGAGLDSLTKAKERFGIISGNTDLESIRTVRDVLTKNQELGDSIMGLNDLMVGLGNQNRSTAQSFADFSAEAVAQNKQLEAELVASGLTAAQAHKAALDVQTESLQTLFELRQRYGYQLDAETEKLLQDAEAAGIVGDAHKSASERMVDGMNRVGDLLAMLARKMGVDVPEALDVGAGRMQGTFNQIGQYASDTGNRLKQGLLQGINGAAEGIDLAVDGAMREALDLLQKQAHETGSLSRESILEIADGINGPVADALRLLAERLGDRTLEWQTLFDETRDGLMEAFRDGADGAIREARRITTKSQEFFDKLAQAPFTVTIRGRYIPPPDMPQLPGNERPDTGFGTQIPEHDLGAFIRRDHVARVHAGELIGPVSFMAEAMARAQQLRGDTTAKTDNRDVVDAIGQLGALLASILRQPIDLRAKDGSAAPRSSPGDIGRLIDAILDDLHHNNGARLTRLNQIQGRRAA